ncbi:MAG: 3-oxoacyl-ACP reductase FabG [Alphaproteobacteria bacterium]|nr:3-oxoacyl-ACP reductase FabG [Alphaproteobacteria bacterium]
MSGSGRLAGKVALVTGGSRGLGRGIAEGFAAEGAKIVVNYVKDAGAAGSVVERVKSEGGNALAIQADVGDAQSVENMIRHAVGAFGTIDILVNNAGLLNSMRLDQMPIEVWDEMIRTHLRGMFLCTRFAIPHMVAQKSGNVINMTGTFGVSGGAEFAHLSAAKAGMIGFTKALAREVGPDGIRVNAIAPAIIRTDLYNHMPDEVRDAIVATYPLRRVGEVEDVVGCALFLATKDSAFVTGQTLCPAGGDVMI